MTLKPFSVKEEVKTILETAGGSLDIKVVCSKFVQKFNASLSSIAGMRPADFLEKEKDTFFVTSRGVVSLKCMVPVSPPGLAASPPALAPSPPGLPDRRQAPPLQRGREESLPRA